VIGTLSLFQEIPNPVVVEAGSTPGPRLDSVRRKRSGFQSNVQARTQNAVYDLFEGLAGLAHFGAQLGRHIVVKGEGGSHILMLSPGHHDVKRYKGHRGLAQTSVL